ncbi:MAG: prepilin peptidase [Actinobacteria bacterium]|nr:prepilin peptidase [Actinomycetota bacterium]
MIAATGFDAFATFAMIPVVVWSVIAGMIATWIAHRYVEATDDNGYEFALLADATCSHCGEVVALEHLVPGRLGICGSCGRALAATWIGGVLATLAGCLAMLATFGNNAALVPYLWLVPVLVTAAIVDLRTMLIPKRVVWVGFGVGFGLIAAVSLWFDIVGSIVPALIGALAYSGFMFVLHIVNPNGLGFGDVRLAMLLGLYLGWIDIRLTLFGLLLGNIIYLTYALPQRLSRGNDAERYSPFGPGLAMGTIVAVVLYSALI